MPLRPILKALPAPEVLVPPSSEASSSSPLPFASCSSCVMFTPHVHFPSTPGLTLTGDTHSPGTYDRAPIVISPNTCALPERGRRVYCTPPESPPPKDSYFHPRAFEVCTAEPVPALLPDLSSETDEWDECASPELTSPEPRVAVRMQGTPYFPAPLAAKHSQDEFDHALSFLPHSPRDPEKCARQQSTHRLRSLERSTFRDGGVEEGDCLGGF
ncbi:hypothetical protein B0H10DRAFT_2074437 [Mycena sp. CBHHK59/15]|nr:hypothetical protein B0H10DRAFT_2074437 [Mycena sp. CBHHK59/15]